MNFAWGFYHKSELRRHIKCCSCKPINTVIEKRVQSSASMLVYSDPVASMDLNKILSKMNYDEVSIYLKQDKLIIKYGNVLCRKLRKSGDQQYHISNKLRELSRLVLESRNCCTDIDSLQDCLKPKNFPFIIQAATELSGWNEEDGTIRCPSIGIKVGHSLKKCCKLLKGEGIVSGLQSLKLQADDFSSLMDIKWNDEIARVARTELDQRKWNKPQLLPLTSDLQILRSHLKQTSSTAVTALANDNNNTLEWRNLATSVLSTLILFNRRRAGEPALLTVDDFTNKLTNTPIVNDEIKASLSVFEQKLCETYKRLEIRGKRGRKVPLLITKDVEKGIKLLIMIRSEVGVSPENPFVFAVPANGSKKNIRGPDAIRKHVKMV